MLAVLSGGGTAGHINPAIATAEVLRERGVEVQFAGRPVGRESEWVKLAGIPFKPFEAEGFRRSHPETIPHALLVDAKSTGAAKKWFAEIKPDVVVGFGGYVTIPVGRAAEKMDIPFVLHEQNSVMGMTNKYLAKKATSVCLTYERAASAVSDASKVVVTGCPVRASVFSATREEGRELLGVPDDARMLLVTGGSLGALHLNNALCSMKERLLGYDDLHIVHVTGSRDYEMVGEKLALTPDEQKRWHLIEYTNQMPACMAATDAIISRAGASSLAEISARAIPAVLVPFPAAAENHQVYNAQSYVDAGCARMVLDADLDAPVFADTVCELIEDADLRASMASAARAQKTQDAATTLADIIMQAAKK